MRVRNMYLFVGLAPLSDLSGKRRQKLKEKCKKKKTGGEKHIQWKNERECVFFY